MIDMILFWIAYGILTVMWWGMIVYWSFPVIDKLIERWTSGDYKNFLSDKFRNPFMIRLGLIKYVDKEGNVEGSRWYSSSTARYRFMFNLGFYSENINGNAVLVFFLSLVGICVNLFVTMIDVVGQHTNLQEVTVYLANFTVEHLSLPFLIIIVLMLIDGVIRKFYKFGKKAKIALDKIEEGE